MLKKAGIVVATAAAGLLAVSPLAFATVDDNGSNGSTGSSGGHSGSTTQINNNEENRERSSDGLFNVDAFNGDNEVNVPIEVCNNNVNIIAVQVEDIVTALGILGDAEAKQAEFCETDIASGGGQSNGAIG